VTGAWWGKRARAVHGVLLAAFVVMLSLSGGARPFDDMLRDMRFQTLQRPASQTLTIVEIDAASLRALDTWPWPRSHYAALIERLRDAGAEVIAFDVDFSSQSNTRDDERLGAVINAAPDSVIVPAFLQQRRNDDPALYETTPQAGLAGDAVIANVNLFPEPNGRVRRGLYQVSSNDGERTSLAAALAGAGPHDGFQIDYGVRPASIARLSFADVLEGDFDPALVRGKRILVGATALELGDELAVPVHGILPGVVVHGLSYESIVQGRTIGLLPPVIALVIALVLLGVRMRKPRSTLSYRSFVPTLGVIASAFVLGWLAQALLPLSVDLGIVYAGEAIWVFYLLLSEMQRRADALVEQREALLRHQAQHDPETALPNQRALLQRVEHLIAQQPDARICVVVAGIDRLPGIRTAIGHQGANDVIRSLAGRIEQVVGACEPARLESSLIGFARAFGADENIETWADCVLKVIGDSAAVDGANIDVSIKLGVAPRDAAQSPSALIEQACAALHAGRRRRARVTLYDAAHSEEPQRRLSLMTDLLAAMDKGGLSVVYQPKQSLKDGALSGAEALLRWHDLERGQVSPELFVTAAEETGHIRQLTKWTLCRVVRDSQTLAAAGAEIPLSFNLSAALLCNDAAIDELLSVAAHSKLKLIAEITETMRIDDADQAARSLERIRAAGIMLSIDDYGMGLSSLSYLRLIQANELKLDKSFTSALMSSDRDRVLIKSTIDLAHALGMKIAAEGVETEHVRDMLRVMGCDSIQGYLYARPMTLTALTEKLVLDETTAEDALQRA
jgi:diguanylate cyclase